MSVDAQRVTDRAVSALFDPCQYRLDSREFSEGRPR
jgi:hypothetical protein